MRGQDGMVAGLLGIMVLVLIGYMVVLPIVNSALYGSSAASANLSGGAMTLSANIPLFLVLGLVLAIVGLFVLRGRM